ncbi:MAG: FimB/Mfa2 family fimbrial subunit [Rikenellaceae bacterium]|nr:FimB/Mfa2 family fimbrial subunit [Rikenellaceae bacterium]
MKYTISIAVLCMATLLAGCRSEPDVVAAATGDGTRTLDITVRAAGLGEYTPELLAGEAEITTLNILAFNTNTAAGGETFLYRVTPLSRTDIDETTVRITAEVPYVTTTYDFVFIANATDEFESLGAIPAGTAKEDILEGLVHSGGDFTGGTAIPMWGESGRVYIPKGTFSASFTVNMIRMVSRVDVLISDEIDPSLFELAAVELHNAYDSGHIAPASDNWDGEISIATAPTVPQGAATAASPEAYTPDQEGAVKGIYLYERPGGEVYDQVGFLLLGGYYDASEVLTWYRIDFLDDPEDPFSYRPLLRNHLNLISITDVVGPGFEDKEEAIKSVPVHLTASVTEWNMNDEDLVIYGSHLLSVSRNNIVTGNGATAAIPVTVLTDYPGGWTARVDHADSGWLSVTEPSPPAGAAGQSVTLVLATEKNETGADRTGTVLIEAGRITYKLYITQSEDADIELYVTDTDDNTVTELLFISDSNDLEVEARTVKVRWEPSSEYCALSQVGGPAPFVYAASSDAPGVSVTSLGGGSATLSIRPQAFTPAEIAADADLQRTATVDFIVANDSGYKKHSLTLRHANYDLRVEPVRLNYKTGRDYVANVVTNGTWSLASVEDLDGILDTYAADPDADTFTFRIKEGMEYFDKLAVANFVSVERPSLTAQLPIRATDVFPNSYMVKQGGQVTIPTHNIAPIWRDLLGETLSGNYEIAVLARDRQEITMSNITLTDGYITATANANTSQDGNIILAAYESGRVVWSWHIWVTSYDPYEGGGVYTHSPGGGVTNVFMDRNLGAWNTSMNVVNSIGYYFQWGRKDALPPPREKVNPWDYSVIIDYWVNNSWVSAIPAIAVTSDYAVNLKNSITNPFGFLTADPDGVGDWYTAVPADRNDYLWSDEDGDKGLFDPCPEGWRVPRTVSGYSPWQGIVAPTVYAGSYFEWSTLGLYPTTGYKSAGDGNHTGFDGTYLWTADPSGTAAAGLNIGGSGAVTHSYGGNVRGAAQPVRCVRE